MINPFATFQELLSSSKKAPRPSKQTVKINIVLLVLFSGPVTKYQNVQQMSRYNYLFVIWLQAR